MRSLIRRRAAAAPQDYAPSRLAYRMERLKLTPLVHKLLRLGLPVFALTMVVGMVIGDESRRSAISEAVAELKTQLANRPEFLVRALKIEGATPGLDAQIRVVLPIDFPVSSFDLDLDAMRATVAQLDPVAEANMQIGTSGMLRLTVVERRPAVIWRGPAGLTLYDAEGHVVTPLEYRAERPDLPVIAGEGAVSAIAEALDVVEALGPASERLRGLSRVGARRWDVILDRGQRILLPEDAPVAALEQVLALDQAQDLLDRDVAIIDMRTPRRPTLRLAEGAQAELRHIRAVQTGDTGE